MRPWRCLPLAAMMAALALAGCADGSPDETPDEPAGPPTAAAPLPSALTWQALAPAALPRAEHWAAEVDGKAYIIGGFILPSPHWPLAQPGMPAGGPPIPTGNVEVYDFGSDSWSAGVDYPGAVDHHPTVAYEGTIYVFKAPTGDQDCYKFTPPASAWEPFPCPPNGHSAGTAMIVGDRIYVVGGSQAVDIFDPATETWETVAGELALMPTQRGHTSGAAVHGKVYVAGGDVGGHSQNTEANEEFDPATGVWATRAPLPVVRGSTVGVTWNDRMVIMGGQSGDDGSPAYPDVNAYDPITDTWEALPDLPVGRHGAATVVYEGEIYVFAGAPVQGIWGFAETHVLRVG